MKRLIEWLLSKLYPIDMDTWLTELEDYNELCNCEIIRRLS